MVLTKLYGQITAGLKRPAGSSASDASINKEDMKRLVASERA